MTLETLNQLNQCLFSPRCSSQPAYSKMSKKLGPSDRRIDVGIGKDRESLSVTGLFVVVVVFFNLIVQKKKHALEFKVLNVIQ